MAHQGQWQLLLRDAAAIVRDGNALYAARF